MIIFLLVVVVASAVAFIGGDGNRFLENKGFGMFGGYQGQGLVRQLGKVSGTNVYKPE